MLDLLEGTYNCSFDVFCWFFFMPFFASNTFRPVLLFEFVVLFSFSYMLVCSFLFRRGKTSSQYHESVCMVLVLVQQNSSQRPGVLKPSIGKWICLPSSAPRPHKKDHALDDLGKLGLEEFHSKCNVQRLIIC